MKKKPEILQTHHLSYDPPITVPVRRKVHFYLTRLQWFKGFSMEEKVALIYLALEKPLWKPEDADMI